MNINIGQWRAAIGNFNHIKSNNKSCYQKGMSYISENLLLTMFIMFIMFLIILDGDIELNPGPYVNNKSKTGISFCHWNLNSLMAHDFEKMHLLKAYNSVHKFDFIFLSETYLNSTVPLDCDNINFDGYNLVRSDHPNDIKRGGVCCYYKESLPVKNLKLNYLPECITLEMIYNKKNYCLPSCIALLIKTNLLLIYFLKN